MSDSDDDDSKTFEPTEKKLREAVERGDLPVSREAALLGGLGATLLICTLTLRDCAGRLAEGRPSPEGVEAGANAVN